MVPQRILLRDFRILVDTRLNLVGAVKEFVLGEGELEEMAVVVTVAARGQPCDHVIASLRHHRQHQDVLGFFFARQAHDHVIGLHLRGLIGVILLGEIPQVFSIVKDRRVLHVVGAIRIGLDQEEILGIADMQP